jgi:hypothetical protein
MPTVSVLPDADPIYHLIDRMNGTLDWTARRARMPSSRFDRPLPG